MSSNPLHKYLWRKLVLICSEVKKKYKEIKYEINFGHQSVIHMSFHYIKLVCYILIILV